MEKHVCGYIQSYIKWGYIYAYIKYHYRANLKFVSFQLQQLGHSVDKVEFIVMGGTFMCLSEEYRDYFIKNLHDALSGHTSSSVEEAVKLVVQNYLFVCSCVIIILTKI